MNIKKSTGLPAILKVLHPKQLMTIKKDYGLTETELLFLKHLHDTNPRSSHLFFSELF